MARSTFTSRTTSAASSSGVLASWAGGWVSGFWVSGFWVSGFWVSGFWVSGVWVSGVCAPLMASSMRHRTVAASARFMVAVPSKLPLRPLRMPRAYAPETASRYPAGTPDQSRMAAWAARASLSEAEIPSPERVLTITWAMS